MSNLPTLAQFCEIRDYHQAVRRLQALPQLRVDKTALKREIDTLKAEIERMGIKQTKGLPWAALSAALHHNHKRDGLAGQVVEIGWKLQEVTGQLAMIEGDKYMMALMADIESKVA